MRKIVSNDIVVIERIAHLTVKDKEIALPIVSIIKVTNGKIALFRDYFDMQTFNSKLPG